MGERILMVIALAVMAILLYQIVVRVQLARVGRGASTDTILQGLRPGIPVVVYFTTPTCIPCRTQQQPALAQLQSELGEAIQIVKVDATENPVAADRWGVLSAPTTFVLDAELHPLHVNHGVADTSTLKRQLGVAA